ncbi:hypothetical protein [Sphaerisporangium sp. NPDC051011]
MTLVRPAGDGWTVEVELVEDHRIPSSGDTHRGAAPGGL